MSFELDGFRHDCVCHALIRAGHCRAGFSSGFVPEHQSARVGHSLATHYQYYISMWWLDSGTTQHLRT